MKKLVIVVFSIIAISHTLLANQFTISDFGGIGKSFFISKQSFKNKVILNPSKAANVGLDIADLNILFESDTIVIENYQGDIVFTSGLFSPLYNNKTLILKSSGNVYLSLALSNTTKINIDIEAIKNIVIDGPGINTNGGSFKCQSKSLTIVNSGLKLNSGALSICALDSIIISGEGLSTSGGSVHMDASYISISNDGIQTQGAECQISAVKDINITGIGINAGRIILSGFDIFLSGQGLQSNGASIDIDFFNEMKIENEGISSNGGNVSIANGCYLLFNNRGLKSSGGDIKIKIRGDIKIYGGGIETNGGDLKITANTLIIDNQGIRTLNGTINIVDCGPIYIWGEGIETMGSDVIIDAHALYVGQNDGTGGTGIQTNNGDINIRAKKTILVRANGIFSAMGRIKLHCDNDIVIAEGGVSTENADIFVNSNNGCISLDGYNLNTNNGKKIGQGILDTNAVDKYLIEYLTEPVLGGGNISIKVGR